MRTGSSRADARVNSELDLKALALPAEPAGAVLQSLVLRALKPKAFMDASYVFVSINHRLLPTVDVGPSLVTSRARWPGY